jgi:hypothetical protein
MDDLASAWLLCILQKWTKLLPVFLFAREGKMLDAKFFHAVSQNDHPDRRPQSRPHPNWDAVSRIKNGVIGKGAPFMSGRCSRRLSLADGQKDGRLLLQVGLMAACVLVVTSTAVAEPPAPSVDLSESRKLDDLARVTALLEVDGHLKLKTDSTNVKKLPLNVSGKFRYEERLLELANGPPAGRAVRAVRHYDRAEASFKINRRERQASLPVDKRLIVVERRDGPVLTVSATGPLTREQLELIDIPGNSLVLGQLLPGKEIEKGQQWQIDDSVLVGMLGWDAAGQCDAKGKLSNVDGNLATIEFEAAASGSVAGVPTKVELKGKCLFDSQRRRIVWLGMALREDRDGGPAQPGFQVTARLKMTIAPLEASDTLADQYLAGLPLTADEGSRLLLFESSHAGCRLLVDRRWWVILDSGEATILRLVDNGDPVAQCNISAMPDLEPGKHVSLEEFQRDLHKALDKNFGQFIEASQSRTDEGLRVLRVTAAGSVSDVGVHWIYYLVSNEKGRRVVFVFMLQDESVEQFAATDQSLMSSFEFLARSPAESPRVTERPDAEATTTE